MPILYSRDFREFGERLRLFLDTYAVSERNFPEWLSKAEVKVDDRLIRRWKNQGTRPDPQNWQALTNGLRKMNPADALGFESGLRELESLYQNWPTKSTQDVAVAVAGPSPAVQGFVSFAPLDNDLFAGERWVQALHADLQVAIRMITGVPGDYLRPDERLAGGHPAGTSGDGRTKRALEASHLLLVVSSKGFLMSVECRAEVRIFLDSCRAGRVDARGRVFKIERDDTNLGEVDAALRDLPRYPFWTLEVGRLRFIGRGHSDYQPRILDVAQDFLNKVCEIEKRAPVVQPVVYLHDSSLDAVQAYLALKRELEAREYRVSNTPTSDCLLAVFVVAPSDPSVPPVTSTPAIPRLVWVTPRGARSSSVQSLVDAPRGANDYEILVGTAEEAKTRVLELLRAQERRETPAVGGVACT